MADMTDTARSILVIGGHGHVARHLADQLKDGPDHVVSVIRNPDQRDDIVAVGAEPLVADVTTLSDSELDDLVAGHDAVVWSAGAGGKGGPETTYAVDRDACIRVVNAVSRASSRPRFVLVSWVGSPDHGVDPDNSFHAYADAKAASDRHTMESDTDWTILGPTTLSHEPAGGITVIDEDTDWTSGVPETSRATVASVIAGCLDEPGTVGRFIRFHDGPTPVAEALA